MVKKNADPTTIPFALQLFPDIKDVINRTNWSVTVLTSPDNEDDVLFGFFSFTLNRQGERYDQYLVTLFSGGNVTVAYNHYGNSSIDEKETIENINLMPVEEARQLLQDVQNRVFTHKNMDFFELLH